MGRRKNILKLPFFKFKINKATLSNVVGFILVGIAVVLMLSFLQKGEILTQINSELINKFGWMGFFSTIIIFLYATHFFNSKKLKIVTFNITFGVTLMFLALIGLFKAGEYGEFIIANLELDFSFVGAVFILGLVFIIGLILFLDTSIDAFLLLIFDLLKMFFKGIKNMLFKESFSNKKIDDKKFLSDEKDFFENKPTKKELEKNIDVTKKNTEDKVAVDQGFSVKVKDDSNENFILPSIDLLADTPQKEADRGDMRGNASIIERTLDSFGIKARVVDVNKGPTVSQYALEVALGTKLSKITTLSNNLAMALSAKGGQIRIEAPIPGKPLVGIEVPNVRAETVTLKRLLSSDMFKNSVDPLLVPLGLDVSGKPVSTSISKFPHVLIAGTTGSGKSVMLNAWITTFLFRTTPKELKMIMVDPKRVELSGYNNIPHLLNKVINDPKEILSALKWTVAEMENRYKIFATYGVRNIQGYNALEDVVKKEYIVFIIDELADLMMFASNEAEGLITRIAQMSRATGIHLILATQRPSVDVITGLMKANIPSRISFNVSSMMDSRVVLDTPGAEKLLGKGDMLFLPSDQPKTMRIQGPYVSEDEIKQVVGFWKQQVPVVHYTDEVIKQDESNSGLPGPMGNSGKNNGKDKDSLFDQALDLVFQYDKASASLLQRKFSIGYNRAAKILDQLHEAGYVGPAEGSKPREVIRSARAGSQSEDSIS